jgi:hypothetical protein
MQALSKAPDCFAAVMTLLDPIELQRMRSVSKGMYRGITQEVMLQCIKSTMARYEGPHAMPDGAVRLYSPFGNSKYDFCQVDGGYQLKQEGFHVQNFVYMVMNDETEIKLETLLSDSGLRITGIRTETDRCCEKTCVVFKDFNKSDPGLNYAAAHFSFELPLSGSSNQRRDEKKTICFFDCIHYEIRVDQLFEAQAKISALESPTPSRTSSTLLRLQLFKANEKIKALESAQLDLETRLANVERKMAIAASDDGTIRADSSEFLSWS